MRTQCCLLLTLLTLGVCLSAVSWAEPAVRVLALFPDKAMLEIDGQRKVLAAGTTGPAGVKLVAADSRRAIVDIDGKQVELTLGSKVSTNYARVERREIRIVKDRRGSYLTDGLINGQSVRFLVDTGADNVAMSEIQADRLGLRYRVEGRRMGVRTASGFAVGYGIELASLSVGGVQLSGVKATVIEGDSPHFVLLGMNVLSQFEIDQRENLLVLRTRF